MIMLHLISELCSLAGKGALKPKRGFCPSFIYLFVSDRELHYKRGLQDQGLISINSEYSFLCGEGMAQW